MVVYLGDLVLNDTGLITGIYHPAYYLSTYKGDPNTHPWNEEFPEWKNKEVFIVSFKEGARPFTDEEIAKQYNIRISDISDKLRDTLAPKLRDMVLPYDHVFKDQL